MNDLRFVDPEIASAIDEEKAERAGIIDRVLSNPSRRKEIQAVRNQVREMCLQFPLQDSRP